MASLTFEAIGCPWRIDTDTPIAPHTAQAIAQRINDFDAAWSRFRPDSTIATLATAPGEVTLPHESTALAELYALAYRATDGAITPFVGGLMTHLGYDEHYTLRPHDGHASVPTWGVDGDWRGQRLRASTPLMLDIGAAGKGKLASLVADLLHAAGHDTFTVDASGDLVRRGEPIRVGLEHPYNASMLVGVTELGTGSLCASASNRRAWGDGLHHLVDARTGSVIERVVATWVRAEDCAVADLLATALFTTDPGELAAFHRYGPFSWVRMFSDGTLNWDTDWPGELFV